jgi:hypothetical protein
MMLIPVLRPLTKDRRERWVFTLAPPSDDGLTFVLDEYAIEVCNGGHWQRPKTSFYKRRRTVNGDAVMAVENVPRLPDVVRDGLFERLAARITIVSQTDKGTAGM